MNNLNHILMKFPGELGEQIRRLPNDVLDNLEEIRMKTGSHIRIFSKGKEYELESQSGRKMDKDLLNQIFNNILNHSAYAYQEELSNGYITIEGGHRVGICGRTVVENGQVKTIKDISSLNIRRSREIIGVSDSCIKFLIKNNQQIYNTVIVSPPKCGKTTLLRDMIRNLSNMGFKVGVCDERSEISGTYNGYANYDLGIRTDVLDGCPKDQGMLMLIRAMSPDIIVTDEIGKKQDIQAIEAAVCAGINLLTTIHGNSFEDLLSSGIGDMVKTGVFQRFIFLSNIPKTGSIIGVRDFKNNLVG